MLLEEMPLVEQFSRVLKDTKQCEKFKMRLESFLEVINLMAKKISEQYFHINWEIYLLY